jgi:integrase
MARPKLAEPVYRLRRRGRYWTVSWTDAGTGKTIALSTGKTDKSQAEVWRDQLLAGLGQPDPPPQPLVADILDGYLADAKKRQVAAHDRLVFAAAVLKRHIGNLEPEMLTRRLYRDRREQEDVADGTIRREIGTLRAALTWAVRERWIERAPYIEMPPAPAPRERWLTRAELEDLIRASAPHIRRFVILAYHTAARAGAILDLTWDRVDLEHRRVDYRRPGRAATNKRRVMVPLNPVVLAELRAARHAELQEATDAREDPPIHVIEHRGRPVQSIKKGFAEACRRAGIEDCSPHTLRHTAATHMVMAGVPLSQIARMLGDSEAMVERVYGKHSPDYLREAADALAGDLRPRLVSDWEQQE